MRIPIILIFMSLLILTLTNMSTATPSQYQNYKTPLMTNILQVNETDYTFNNEEDLHNNFYITKKLPEDSRSIYKVRVADKTLYLDEGSTCDSLTTIISKRKFSLPVTIKITMTPSNYERTIVGLTEEYDPTTNQYTGYSYWLDLDDGGGSWSGLRIYYQSTLLYKKLEYYGDTPNGEQTRYYVLTDKFVYVLGENNKLIYYFSIPQQYWGLFSKKKFHLLITSWCYSNVAIKEIKVYNGYPSQTIYPKTVTPNNTTTIQPSGDYWYLANSKLSAPALTITLPALLEFDMELSDYERIIYYLLTPYGTFGVRSDAGGVKYSWITWKDVQYSTYSNLPGGRHKYYLLIDTQHGVIKLYDEIGNVYYQKTDLPIITERFPALLYLNTWASSWTKVYSIKYYPLGDNGEPIKQNPASWTLIKQHELKPN